MRPWAVRVTMIEGLEARRLLSGSPTFSVSFNDPGGAYSDYYTRVRSTILAAANDWSRYIDSSASIELSVDFDATLTAPTLATAGFDKQVYFRQGDGFEVDMGNVTAELRTGVDQNGSAPDAEISIRPGALSEFYFDSSADRSGTLPSDKIDARSVLLHELGHALGFFADGGGPHDSPAGDRLVYDTYVELEGSTLYFTGPNAEAAYGGNPVPLSQDDASHVGNDSGPGMDLDNDLMSPAIPDGEKRYISDVDLGILADAGVPLKESLVPAVAVGNIVVARSSGATADFVLTLSKPSGTAITVPVKTINGTAIAGKDYVALNQNVTFQPGETSKKVSVTLLAGSPFDKDKTLTLNLGLPSNALLADGQAVATLQNPVLAADAHHAASFKDNSGNLITISLRGSGVATVNRDDSGNLRTVSIAGSNSATTLVIRSKKPDVLYGISAPGGLGGIDAPTTSFSGTLVLAATSSVKLQDILAGTTMTLGASGKQLALVARNIFDASITDAGAIRTFTAQSWKDTDDSGDLLAAAKIGKITIKGEMQGNVNSAGTIGNFSAGTLRSAVIQAAGSVTSFTVGSALSSDVLVGTNLFAESEGDFFKKSAMIKKFTVKTKGVFSDTRVAAGAIGTAALGAIHVDNSGAELGVAALSIGSVSASTPMEPKFSRKGLKSPASITEGDFVVRIV